MNNPLVSILVPVYNVEAYLPQCLDSLLGQTYSHLQIVLIDDGSSDNSWAIMQQYAAQDSRIEIYHQENQGVAVTRNHLLEKIKGDFVLFVDSDDWVELDMVEFLLGKATENQADVVTCGNVINDGIPQTVYTEEFWPQEKVIKEFLRHIRLNGSLCNKLVKTSLLHNCKFHCGISYGEDALFCWSFLQDVSSIVLTGKQLYHYRKNPQSISRQKWTPEKKGTGHFVWQEIVKDTAVKWPQYLSVAKARFAIEDFWGIYFAALSDYNYDEHIKLRQRSVIENSSHILSSRLLTIDKLFSALILARCYNFGKILKFLKK